MLIQTNTKVKLSTLLYFILLPIRQHKVIRCHGCTFEVIWRYLILFFIGEHEQVLKTIIE